MAKMYFKGDSGIKKPVDIDGLEIIEGSILSTDYGDNSIYGIKNREDQETKPFFLVKVNENGGFYAESIEPCGGILGHDKYFYLHDFRFKFTKKLS